MDVRRLPIQEVRPAPYNPRRKLKPGTPAFQRLERSLAEFSLVQPLVWNQRTGHLVGGHQRLEILKHHGATEVDVVVVDLPLEREKALNIALNNQQVGGDWDLEKLGEVLEELQALPEFDISLTGFDERDLRHLLLTPEEDLAPEESTETTRVEIRISINPEDWQAARPGLDAWLQQYQAEVHIKLPNAGK